MAIKPADSKKRIFVAGHNGMVGRALVRLLSKQADTRVITADRSQLDLVSADAVLEFVSEQRPDEVYIAAAKVGGIHANSSFPAEFIYQNLMIESNLIQAAHQCNVNKLMFLGSSCIYPRHASQPIREDALLTGALEPTNEPYAIAKIAGIKLCESYNRQYGRDYRSVMPTNLYGPFDNFHPQNSHVIPAMLRRFHAARLAGQRTCTVWGSGTPLREFLHVDDLAAAAVHVMNLAQDKYHSAVSPMCSHINVGVGEDCSIRELAIKVAEVVGFTGGLHFDRSKPDGAPRKLLDTSSLSSLGWQPGISLQAGLTSTYQWYCDRCLQ